MFAYDIRANASVPRSLELLPIDPTARDLELAPDRPILMSAHVYTDRLTDTSSHRQVMSLLVMTLESVDEFVRMSTALDGVEHLLPRTSSVTELDPPTVYDDPCQE